MKPLRIGVVGPIVGGSRSIAQSAVVALERLGHEVRFLDNASFAPHLDSIRRAPDSEAMKNAMAQELFKLAARETRTQLASFHPDVALYLAQAPVLSDDDTAPLREAGILTIFWLVEDRRVFTYWQRTASRFDVLWGIQDGTFADELASISDTQFAHVPLACDSVPPTSLPAPNPLWSDRVTFAGSPYPNRLALLRELALPDLRIFGPGFSAEPSLRANIAIDRTVEHELFPQIFSGSRINLNLSSSTVNGDWNARKNLLNPRAFEIAGAGGFQLAESLLPIEKFFEPGAEIVTFSSVEEARELIARYSADATARAAVASRAQARALAEHTYERRLSAALAQLPEWLARASRRRASLVHD